MSTKRLLRTYKEVDNNSLDDVFYLMARNVEDALITGGAVPGKDYTILDCYKLAQPFALELLKKREDMTYTISSAGDRD